MSYEPRSPRNINRPPQRPQRKSGRQRGAVIFDTLTAIFALGTVLIIGITLLILSDPSSAVNPLPKPTQPKLLIIPTATITHTPTITQTPLPTLSPTPLPSFTPTDIPSETPTPTASATFVISVEETLPPVATIPPTRSPFEFIVDSVDYQSNTNEFGCNWTSIAGTVTDINGQPVIDLPVEVDGENFKKVVFSGTNVEFGASGFEVDIDTKPSGGEYSVRLLGPTGLPITDFVTVALGDTCDTNVAIVNFIELRQ